MEHALVWVHAAAMRHPYDSIYFCRCARSYRSTFELQEHIEKANALDESPRRIEKVEP